MKKKIAHIAGGLTSGGVEAVLLNYFSHMDRTEYELHYISYGQADQTMKEKFEKLGFIIHEVPKKKEHFLKSTSSVYKILKDNQINIVHSHMTLMSFMTSFLGQLCGIKVRIAHSHLAQYPRGIKKYVYGIFKVFTRISSNYYFACGVEAAEYLYGEKNVNTGNVHIMHNAIDLSRYFLNLSTREMVRKELGLEGKFCLGNVGRFQEQKNQTFLIQIFEKVYAQNRNARLILIGDGEDTSKIKTMVAEKQLENVVTFLGQRSDVDRLYQAMDVFVLPSLYEGLAVALVEAQCNGLPIIASDTVTREIDLFGDIKYLSLKLSAQQWAEAVLEKEDKIDRMKSEEEIKNVLEQAGYSIDKEAKELDEMYTQMLQ